MFLGLLQVCCKLCSWLVANLITMECYLFSWMYLQTEMGLQTRYKVVLNGESEGKGERWARGEERRRLKKYERGEGRGGVRGDEEYGRVKFSPSINWQNLTCWLWILASGVTLQLYKIIHTHLFSLWSRKILTLEGRRHHRTSDVGSQTLDGVVPFGEVSQYERFYVPGILQCCFSHLGLNLTSSVECINRSDKLVLHRDLWSNSQSLAVTFHYNCHCY